MRLFSLIGAVGFLYLQLFGMPEISQGEISQGEIVQGEIVQDDLRIQHGNLNYELMRAARENESAGVQLQGQVQSQERVNDIRLLGLHTNRQIYSGNQGHEVEVRLTHYTPWEGGTNCYTFINGVCESATASGIPWEVVEDVACACPYEFPLGTVFEIQGSSFICLDRGSMICDGGVCHLDILTALAIDGYYTATYYQP